MKKALLIKGFSVLCILWLLVWGVGSWASSRKASADRVETLIDEAGLEDWSEGFEEPTKEQRKSKIDEIAKVLNRLDLREREQLRDRRAGRKLFEKLGSEERLYFLEKTLTTSMRRMMEAFDKMDREQRREMVQRSIKDMMGGPGGEDLERLKEENPEIVEEIVRVGLQVYYQKASAETKLDLVPLMDAFEEVIKGFAKPNHEL